MKFIFVFLIMALGGMVQGACGFGAGLICMSVLPYMIDYKELVPMMYIAAVVISLRLIIKTYKHINWKVLLMPTAVSLAGRGVGIFAFKNLESAALGIILGILIILAAIFQLVFKNRIKIAPTHKNGAIAGLLSGVMGGIAGTGGPPLVVYYMNTGLEKYEYISTIQMSFLMGALFSIGVMAAAGGYSVGILKYSAVAAVGIAVGGFLGLKIFHRINKEKLIIVINIMLLITGSMLIVKSIY